MNETIISHPQQQQTNKNLFEYLFNIIYKLVPQRYTGQQCNQLKEKYTRQSFENVQHSTITWQVSVLSIHIILQSIKFT